MELVHWQRCLFNKNIAMGVSVRESHAAAGICSENKSGYLESSFAKNSTGRQNIKNYYEYDGVNFVINFDALK